MYRINKILCKTDLKPIQRLTYECNNFNDVHFQDSIVIPAVFCN